MSSSRANGLKWWWNYIRFWQQCCWKVKSSGMWHCWHWASGCWRYCGRQCLQHTAAYYQSPHSDIPEDSSHAACNLHIIFTTFHILIPTPHHLSQHSTYWSPHHIVYNIMQHARCWGFHNSGLLTVWRLTTHIWVDMGRTAPLTSKRCILYIYSTNIGAEYFKHALYSPFFLFKMQFVS